MKKWMVVFFALATIFAGECIAGDPAAVTVSATAQDTWTDGIEPWGGSGQLNVSIAGTWVGTVTLQRSFNAGVSWQNVETWTANAEEQLWEFEADVLYRLGIATGNYVSGTAVLRLSK